MLAADPEHALRERDVRFDVGAGAKLFDEFENAIGEHVTDLVHRVLDQPEPSDDRQAQAQMEVALQMATDVHYALVRHLAREYRVQPDAEAALDDRATNLKAALVNSIEDMTTNTEGASYIAGLQLRELASAVKATGEACAPLYSKPMADLMLPTREALTSQHDLLVQVGHALAKHYGLDFAEACRFA